MNVNQGNADDILRLCDELMDEIGQHERFYVYAAPIRNAEGKTSEEDKEAVLCIEEKLINTRLSVPGKLDNSFKLNRCMADDDSNETILPDGKIGKCEHFSDSEFIGSIYDETQDQDMISAWKETMEPQEVCAKCPLYPRCIRLKKCEWEKFGCSEADRQLKIQRLKDQIRNYQV